MFHPRTEKNATSLNLVRSKRKAANKFRMNLSKKSQKKKSPKFRRLRRKQAHFFFHRVRRIGPAHLGGATAKKVREAKADVRQAAHLLLFVVRYGDFSGKWCNCATFHHLIITLVQTACNEHFNRTGHTFIFICTYYNIIYTRCCCVHRTTAVSVLSQQSSQQEI